MNLIKIIEDVILYLEGCFPLFRLGLALPLARARAVIPYLASRIPFSERKVRILLLRAILRLDI